MQQLAWECTDLTIGNIIVYLLITKKHNSKHMFGLNGQVTHDFILVHLSDF